MLQQEEPEDFVIATGEQHSVREFCELAFAEMGINLSWEGEGVEEVGRDDKGQVRVQVDPRYFRPTEVESLLGDASNAKEKLGWTPEISFQEMVKEMVQNDYHLAQRDKLCNDHGYDVCNFQE